MLYYFIQMEIKLVENEAAISMLRKSYEKRILDEEAELKKQARKFQEEEASLLDQLASSKRTVASLTEEVQKEELVEQLNLEIDELKIILAQAEENRHLFEGKLKEMMEMLDILHDKVNLLSQEINGKEQYTRELSSSLSAKEDDYQNLNVIYHQTEENLEQVTS
jgi:chromosome segregation ATPase